MAFFPISFQARESSRDINFLSIPNLGYQNGTSTVYTDFSSRTLLCHHSSVWWMAECRLPVQISAIYSNYMLITICTLQ